MTRKVKKIALILLGVSILGGGSFAAYKFSNDILGVFEEGYSNSYTLEEVNDKILKYQNATVLALEETYNQTIEKSQSQRINGSLGLNIEANSSFGGGNGNMALEKIDVQYTPTGLDLLLKGLAITGEAQVFGEKMGGNMKLGEGHLITNASGSYLFANELLINTEDLGTEPIPEEIIMTLNKLGESGKYVDLSENFIYELMQKQIQSQSGEVEEFQKDVLEFLKEKPVFVAYKQEDTKYHIMPSRELCSFTLNIYTKAQGIESEECNDEQYQLVSDYFITSDYHEIKNFYIQLNTTKLNYVFDSVISTPDSSSAPTIIETGFEGTVSLTKTESSKMYMRIKNDIVTGSGILLEQTNGNLSGYIDIDVPSYNFDSNLNLSGTTDSVSLAGDYSFIAPDEMSQRDLRYLEGVKFNGEMAGIIGKENYNLEITNTFSQEEIGINGSAKIALSGTALGDKNNGEMIINGELKMGANASPISGDITAKWDTQTNENLAKGDISYELNIPNIASGKYEVNYDFIISDTLESTFETPKNIIPQKNLNSLIMINKRIVEKEKAMIKKEKAKEMEDFIKTMESGEEIDLLGLDFSAIPEYKINDMNAKTNSDIRTIAMVVEISQTDTGKPLNSYVINKTPIEINGGILYKGAIDFDELGQNEDGLSSSHEIPYQIRTFSIDIDDVKYDFYQIHGYTIKDNKLVDVIKGNYIPVAPDMPKSLFDIEVK